MRIKSILLIIFICFSGIGLWAQSTVEDSIKVLEQSMEKHNDAIDEIFSELEILKLQKVRKTIKQFGLPTISSEEQIIEHDALTLSYNEEHEQANWVVHVITKDVMFGNVGRTNNFRLDPLVETITADSADYWDSGYDRGHLAPSADFRWSLKALSQSYFYSNMSPQRPELNRESWARLENLVREWAIDADELIVVTGPVLNKNLKKIPQGSLDVSIPELYFKVILDNVGDEKRGIGFILPNQRVRNRLVDYAVSIDSIEILTGIDFYPALENTLENEVEANNDPFKFPINRDAISGEVMPIDFEKGQIAAAQAKYFVGDEITVCGKVVSTKFSENGKSNPTYINLDKKFPDQVFTLVIFGKDRMNFTYEPEKFLYNKNVCITGEIGEWKGTPQMVINHESALEVIPEVKKSY